MAIKKNEGDVTLNEDTFFSLITVLVKTGLPGTNLPVNSAIA